MNFPFPQQLQDASSLVKRTFMKCVVYSKLLCGNESRFPASHAFVYGSWCMYIALYLSQVKNHKGITADDVLDWAIETRDKINWD